MSGHRFHDLVPQGMAVHWEASHGIGSTASIVWYHKAWPVLGRPAVEEGVQFSQQGSTGILQLCDCQTCKREKSFPSLAP